MSSAGAKQFRISHVVVAIAQARRAQAWCVGLFGRTVQLQAGEMMTVDDAYLREAILTPSAKVAAGFQPIVPTFPGLITEEGLLGLIEYVKSLKALPQVQAR